MAQICVVRTAPRVIFQLQLNQSEDHELLQPLILASNSSAITSDCKHVI